MLHKTRSNAAGIDENQDRRRDKRADARQSPWSNTGQHGEWLTRASTRIEHGIGRWPVPALAAALLVGVVIGCWVKR